MPRANSYQRKIHQDSPSRWFRSFASIFRQLEGSMIIFKINMNSDDAEKRIGPGNQTFWIKEIISICLRLNIFLLKWYEVNKIDRSLFQNQWKKSSRYQPKTYEYSIRYSFLKHKYKTFENTDQRYPCNRYSIIAGPSCWVLLILGF